MNHNPRRRGLREGALGCSFGLLIALHGAGLAPGWAQTAPVERAVIASAEPCLDLHAEPDSNSAAVRCLAPGRRMNLLESRDGWARVRLADGQEGWVLFRLVRPAIESSGSAQSRQIGKLESALAAAAIERTELQRGTSALRSEIYELRLANESLMASAGAQASAESNADQRIGELESALAAARSQSQVASDEAARLRKKVTELETEALDRENQVEDLAGRLEAAEILLAEAESRRLESSQELEILWREEAALRKRAEGERRAYQAEADRRVDELESALALAEADRLELDAPQPDRVSGSRLELLEEALGSAEAERLKLEVEKLELEREVARLTDANEWLAVAAVERRDLVTVASAAPREYEGASEPVGSGNSGAESVPEPAEPASRAQVKQPEASVPIQAPTPAPIQAPLAEAEPARVRPEARDATAAVEAWARAWSEQRVEDYLYFYSRSFEPPDSASREEWEAQRRLRVAGPDWIDVRVALADLEPLGEDRMAVVFLQSYESDLMTDVVLKTLELVREDGGWKIAAERVE